MDIKKLLLSTLAAFVVMFVISFVWYVLLMADFYQDNPGEIGSVDRANPMLQYIMLGYLILAALMAYMYPKGSEGDSLWVDGLKFGFIIGILWVLPNSVVTYGVTTVFSKKAIFVDTLYHLVEQGAGGIVIALIYGRSGTSTSELAPGSQETDTAGG